MKRRKKNQKPERKESGTDRKVLRWKGQGTIQRDELRRRHLQREGRVKSTAVPPQAVGNKHTEKGVYSQGMTSLS